MNRQREKPLGLYVDRMGMNEVDGDTSGSFTRLLRKILAFGLPKFLFDRMFELLAQCLGLTLKRMWL